MTHPATDLRISLTVASRAAYLDGATDRQIDMLVALARGTKDYNLLAGGRLTRAEASRIIDSMVEAGAVADGDVTDAELDDEDELKAQADRRAAERKIVKAQDKAAKARRDAQKLEAAKADATGRKVRHAKFGVGDVIAEDESTVTAIFSGQKKALKIGKSFLAEV